jgi:hypothetical protein
VITDVRINMLQLTNLSYRNKIRDVDPNPDGNKIQRIKIIYENKEKMYVIYIIKILTTKESRY